MSRTKRKRNRFSDPQAKRLAVEPLEDRRMLAVIIVNSSADDLVANGTVTLREAIQAANTDASVDGSTAGSGADTIEFDGFLSGKTITLGGTNLEITEALTIDATALAQNVVVDANLLSRIFNITAATGDFTLAGLTLTGGRTLGDDESGGALRSITTGNLTLDRSTVSGNGTAGFAAYGGGIYSLNAVTLTDSTVSGNSTADTFARGGGIYSQVAVTLTDSTVSGNSTAGLGADGGGISSQGTVTLTSSTVSGNSTTADSADGGGIFSLAGAAVTLTSSTVSGNSTAGNSADGGGIYSKGAVTLVHSTITDNHAIHTNAFGGGIWNDNDLVVINHSIVAGNTDGGSMDDIRPGSGTLSIDFSLIEDIAGLTINGSSNITGMSANLGPLADNGGPTQTHALLPGSLALDAGDPGFTTPPDFDQRGAPFVRVFNGRIDMGALELDPPSPAQGLVVDTVSDVFDSNFTIGNFSLREAVFWANVIPLADTITFDPSLSGQTISLTTGELVVTDSLSIAGPGQDLLTIDALESDATPFVPDGMGSRMFDINDGNDGNSIDVTISGLTLSGGDVADKGGAIRSRENLSIISSTITGSSVVGINAEGGGIYQTLGDLHIEGSTISLNTIEGGDSKGGGIFAINSNVTLVDSTISHNSAVSANAEGGGIYQTLGDLHIEGSTILSNTIEGGGSEGGGIFALNGNVTIVDSTIGFNKAKGNSTDGGGIVFTFGDLTIDSSTFRGNSADDVGGAIFGLLGDLTINSSTFSNNSAVGSGGGIALSDFFGPVTATIAHSTIANNVADELRAGTSLGGGIYLDGATVSLALDHTIVADNTDWTSGAPDISGTVSANFSLIEDTAGAMISGTGNITGLDPMLGPLTNNGGPTETLALLDSPAIDAGDPMAMAGMGGVPLYDQRGAPFDRVVSGRIDIGAIEWQPPLPAQGLVVDTVSDSFNNNFSIGNLALREAVFLANLDPLADTITFDPSLSGQTITLFGTDLEITESVTIDATALASNVTIDANQLSRIFDITVATGDFMIAGLTLTGGRSTAGFLSGRGGAIRSLSSGTLTIDQSTVSGNRTYGAEGKGGGISSVGPVTLTGSTVSGNSTVGNNADGGGIHSSGNVTLTHSTVSGNSTSSDAGRGGGIFSGGALTLTRSTVSGNSTAGDGADGGGIFSGDALTLTSSTVSGNSTTGLSVGGGILSFGPITLTHSTVAANHAFDALATGGGIWNSNDLITIANSIVAGNTAGGGMNDIDPGSGTLDIDFSLIEDIAGLTITGSNNITGMSANLGPLAKTSGPTKTHGLLAGSPAIDAGDPNILFDANEFDQRGAPFVRVFDGGVAGVRIDIGAYERQTVAGLNLVVDTPIDENDGDFTNGDLSLREAAGLANGSVGANTITFDATVFATPQTILLHMGEIDISEAITIDATTVANVTIDAQQQSRILNIIATSGDFTLAGLSLTGGRTIGDNLNSEDTTFSGGAVRSLTTGSVTIDQSTVSGNSTTGDSASGGGIFSLGPVSITQSTVSGNSTGVFGGGGGGIFASGSVTLTGSTVSGNSTGSGGGGGGGIFSTGTVTLTGSMVSGNSTGDGGGSGGGILAHTITLTGSTVSGNSTAGEGANGGGIDSFFVTLNDSTVSGNSTTGEEANGGGISARFSATLTNSTVSGNSTSGRHAKGGGIYSHLSGPVTLTGSTVSGNSTLEQFAHGGGIYSYGPVTLTNSTVSENNSSVFKSSGGGIYSLSIVTLTHSTVTANHAGSGDDSSGGGIYSETNLTIDNSIVAGNTARDMNDIDPGFGSLTIDFSLIGDNDGTGLTEAPVGSPDINGNLIGGSINGIIDPLLDPLADNGGPTETHALLVGSPAIDAGDPSIVFNSAELDQRGAPFARVYDDPIAPGSGIDMGAFELQPPFPAQGLIVDTATDLFDGDFTIGNLALREAIYWANLSPGADTITFDAAIAGQTITLSIVGDDDPVQGKSAFRITESLVIDGSGASGLTIDASGNDPTPGVIDGLGSRIFRIDDGDPATFNDVSIVGVTLTGGDLLGGFSTGGGAILSKENLSISQSTIIGNSTAGDSANGGGIASLFGDLTITDSTISGNSTTGFEAEGGGIDSRYGATLTITDSTIAGNSTAGTTAEAGGILVAFDMVLLMTGSTVSGNITYGSGASGAGIFSLGADVTITNSTISGNEAQDASGGGIAVNDTELTLTSSTVSGNSSSLTSGGIWNYDGPTIITNSIVAGNMAGGGMDDINPGTGLLTVDFSLIGDNDGTGLTEAPVGSPDINGNLIGGPINGVIDPLLDALADNGGPTETHALLAGSPAIDAGDPTAMAGVGGVPMFDQRGMPFGRVEDGDGNMVARIDMGAYEVQSTTVPTCDFDGMNGCNIDDIDAMVMEIVAGTNSPLYDLTVDGLVNLADRDQWLADAGALNLTSGNPYLLGDSNLDGVVDGQDFLVWNANKFMSTGKWSQADWNADGVTDGQDFIIWNGNKFQSSDAALRSVLPSASHPSYEIAPTVDLQTREQSPTRLLGISQVIPSTNTKRIDAVFAGFHQREERVDEQRQADIFDALIEDFPMKSYLL